MSLKVDYLIAGGGLAGLTLAYELSGFPDRQVAVIDNGYASSSSRIAAGIIRPVTGRRIVKTRMADTLLPFAFAFYETLENLSASKCFFPMPIAEVFDSVKSRNDWMARSGLDDYASYIGDEFTSGALGHCVRSPHGGIFLKYTAAVDAALLMTALESLLVKRGVHFLHHEFRYEEFSISSDKIYFRNTEARRLIFAEGWKAVGNPWFSNHELLPVKGELLIIEAPELQLNCILNSDIYLIPYRENLFIAGSTYEWNFADDKPTDAGKRKIVSSVMRLIACPFNVTDHKAAIRPANQQRVPATESHPVLKNVYRFNGLGTKGFLLAPFYAKQLAQLIFQNEKSG